ncbi:MAG: class I SAM-dependent methyltransferase [Solirubrobacteraceae bacterium]
MTEPRTISFGASEVAEQYSARLSGPIFEPWAEQLVTSAAVDAGERVLDLASGTGAVARAAARAAGSAGGVLATDISSAMLATSAAAPVTEDSATIEFLEAPADAVPAPDQSFDVVLCQQGLQFMPERQAVVGEARRLLRPGGRLAATVWARGHRLIPFVDYAAALAGAGVEPPFPRAFEAGRYSLEPDDLRQLLDGFAATQVSVVELRVSWSDAETAADAILGTPFAPLFVALSPERQAEVRADLVRRFAPGTGTFTHSMHAVLALAAA